MCVVVWQVDIFGGVLQFGMVLYYDVVMDYCYIGWFVQCVIFGENWCFENDVVVLLFFWCV